MSEKERRYDIDWLRNFGIFLLFPFHAARFFDYWDPFYVKNETLSWGLSWFISVANLWFMPLLLWLAGSPSWYVRITDKIQILFSKIKMQPPANNALSWPITHCST